MIRSTHKEVLDRLRPARDEATSRRCIRFEMKDLVEGIIHSGSDKNSNAVVDALRCSKQACGEPSQSRLRGLLLQLELPFYHVEHSERERAALAGDLHMLARLLPPFPRS
jgi:hypothetical protein